MNKMIQGCFTTGEFARICSTTKETLFHYDEIGLLKPQYTGENRYRYYSAKQFYQYDLIDTLKMAGCSLAEIKAYMSDYDPHKYMDLLDQCFQKLETRRREIEKMQNILQNSMECVQTALNIETDKPYLEECEEEYLVVTRVRENDEMGYVYALHDHFKYCSEYKLGDEFPVGNIMMEDDIRNRDFRDWYYYSRVSGPMDSARLFKKPAGTYAAMLHHGTYEEVAQACGRLLDYVEQQGYEVNGNGYVYDLIGYFASQSENDFVLKISFAIKSGKVTPI